MEEKLKRLLSENKVIPFIGAGVSMAIKDKDGNQLFPSWTELLKKFAYNLEKSGHSAEANLINAYFGLSKFDYLEVADKIKKFYPSKQSFNDVLKEIFDKHSSEIDLESLALPKSIWELGQDLIITTNYDKVLHWASYSPSDTAYWDIQSISEQGKALRDGVLKPTVWHLHGHIEHIDNLVLTTESYNKLYDNNANSEFKAAYTALLTFLASKSFLFIGYSLDDEFFVNELEKICAIFDGNSSEHYVLLRQGSKLPDKLKGKIIPISFENYGQPLIDKIKSLIPTTNEPIEKLPPVTSTPPKNYADYLTSLPPRNENFLGRVKELEELENTLTNEGMVYVVNGIGGVGKSELSYEYLHRNKERYNNIAFLEFTHEVSSIEELFRIKFKDRFALTENDDLDSIITKLQRLQSKNLLLLDNLQNREDFEKIKALNTNFDLLITTRRGDLESRYSLNLEVLSDKDARALFVSYYPTEENIDDILKYLDNHSLFIYLTAKTLASGYLTLEELRENIKNGQIGKIEAHDEKSFDLHLEQRFKRQFEEEQNPDLKLLLQQLSTFPSIEIEEEKLLLCLTDINTKRNLAKLVQRGWLTKKEDSYKLHQIIKTFIWDNYSLPYIDAIPIIDSISSYIDTDDAALIVNYELVFIPIIDSLLSFYGKNKDNHIAGLLDSLTFLYYSTGNYKKSLEIQIHSKNIRLNIFGEYSVEITKNYNLEGVLHIGFGQYDKALLLIETVVKIREERLGKNHCDTLQSYNNLAVIYDYLTEHERALFFHKKNLDGLLASLGEKHLNTSLAYNNLSSYYFRQNEYKKAFSFITKSLNIRKKIVGDKHPLTADAYDNLGTICISFKKYEDALSYYSKALDIREEIVGEKHPKTALSYKNIGNFYYNTHENKKALIYLDKALKINEELLGEKHPEVALVYIAISYAYEALKQCSQSLEIAKKAIKIFENLDYKHSDLSKSQQQIKIIEQKLIKEKKLHFNKKGRYCRD